MAAGGIPPLSIAAGPSGADGQASGENSSGTGEFFFGTRPKGGADVLNSALPFVIMGAVVLWAIWRR